MKILLFVALSSLAGISARAQDSTRKPDRWPASPAMTMNGKWWCADGLGANGYKRVWEARKNGWCYEKDAAPPKPKWVKKKAKGLEPAGKTYVCPAGWVVYGAWDSKTGKPAPGWGPPLQCLRENPHERNLWPYGWSSPTCKCIENANGVCMTLSRSRPYYSRGLGTQNQFLPTCVDNCLPGWSEVNGTDAQTEKELAACSVDWERLKRANPQWSDPNWRP